ncbi:MAG: hypothetical protein JST88_10430 [Bacteroidetes bacterium]|nr:hypothetical protein [Bacteroidota bacterium]
MKNKRLFILTLSLFALCYAACNRCNNQTYSFTQHQIDFIKNFKEGSYWIMRDSITGRGDSFVCIDNHYDGFRPINVSKHCSDQMESQDALIYHFNGGIFDSVMVGFGFAGGGRDASFAMIYPPWNSSRGQGFQMDFNDVGHTVTVLGKPYTNVRTQTKYWTQGQSQCLLSLLNNDSLKLIKIRYKDTIDYAVWELVRANIIKP